MPTIGIKKVVLDEYMDKVLTEKEWEALCFEYGLELDEVTSEKASVEKEKGAKSSEKLSEEEVYKIELPANRYDLLCVEGLTRALLIFEETMKPPTYKLTKPAKMERLVVKDHTNGGKLSMDKRPFVVAAILRDVTITQEAYNSFIDLQDKLHQNIGRKRTLVSMGTHDLDTVTGPFEYRFMEQKDIVFRALNQAEEMDATKLLEVFQKDTNMKQYVPIIGSDPNQPYPVILDSKSTVMSMPPMINSDKSKITLNTKNIFIEITATDLTKAKVTLDTLCALFSQYCKEPFTVEPVEVVMPDGSVHVYPELSYRTETVRVEQINKKIGIDLSAERMASLLTKMSLESTVIEGTNTLSVVIPPTRHDILHECDIAEDVGVAFGFNNIEHKLPEAHTVGAPLPMNKFTDLLRINLAMIGWTEALNFALCSKDDLTSKLRLDEKDEFSKNGVEIANPKTQEFQVARTNLLSGLLKTLASNRDMALPLRLFEIQDVVLRDDSNEEVGARNERRLAAVYMHKAAGFEIIHGFLDRVMELIGIAYGVDKKGYYIREDNCPTYFSGRCAAIVGPNDVVLGRMGILHPEVLTAFGLTLPVSALEINIEPLL
uniref:Phenylalanine--tRNA ligase beta subunit n=1 Tax=Steinernema glaseri TaxID=37863 RepID=A0A1I7YFS6_9BILA